LKRVFIGYNLIFLVKLKSQKLVTNEENNETVITWSRTDNTLRHNFYHKNIVFH